MNKIIAIVGESGTGKTLIAKYIKNKYNISEIKSYTTRPKRYKTEDNHIFITNEQFSKLDKNTFIAYTYFGGHHYFSTKDQLNKINTYTIDDNGLKMLKNNKDIEVISIRLKRQHKGNISISRQTRDKGMFTLGDSEYDHIIINDGTKEELYKKVDEILKEVIK